MRPSILAAFCAVAALLCVRPCEAGPIWGESPFTFSFNVLQPDLLLGYQNQHKLMLGSSEVPNPDALRRTRLDSVLSLEYGVKTGTNVRIDVPYSFISAQQRINGEVKCAHGGGLGDIMLSTRHRFYNKIRGSTRVSQALIGGIKLPTGECCVEGPDGHKHPPSEQPGTGEFGLMAGYAIARESRYDYILASAVYGRDIGGVGCRGDLLALDAQYVYWAKRPNRPQDLGIELVAGPRFEIAGRDHQDADADEDTGYRSLSFQLGAVATSGQSVFRAGLLIPLAEKVNGTQLRPDVQVRARFIMFL